MHVPSPVVVTMACSLFAVSVSLLSTWRVLVLSRARGRKAVEARLAGLGETPIQIIRQPHGSWWSTAGLTGGAIVFRVVARASGGEERIREWAYDPRLGGDWPADGLKTFAHGIWIPLGRAGRA